MVAAVYAVAVVRFVIGQPRPTVDYVAELAAPSRAVPINQRAWPLWRSAMLGCMNRRQIGWAVWPDAFAPTVNEPLDWHAQAAWLAAHADSLAVARRAAAKPALGFVVGPDGSGDDPVLFPDVFPNLHENPGEAVAEVHLPHVDWLREMATLLSADVRLAAEQNDGGRVEADVVALHRLAGQLRSSGGILITQLSAVGVEGLAIERLGRVVADHPGVLSDAALVRLAHGAAGPQTAADLIDLRGERVAFADAVQRMYTDDGHGDGRLTWAGVLQLSMYAAIYWTGGPGRDDAAGADGAALLPFAVASRAQVTAKYAAFMDRVAANLARPRRSADWASLTGEVAAWRASAVDRVRFAALFPFLLLTDRPQVAAERYLGARDGLLVGIALELYHRRHGRYPAMLAELTPDLLPSVPADRITGDPVRYRLVGGKPVVYSVGADRVDDGGRPAVAGRPPKSLSNAAAMWDVSSADAPRGDWVLYPPAPADEWDDQ